MVTENMHKPIRRSVFFEALLKLPPKLFENAKSLPPTSSKKSGFQTCQYEMGFFRGFTPECRPGSGICF